MLAGMVWRLASGARAHWLLVVVLMVHLDINEHL